MIYLTIIAGLFALDQLIKKHIENQPGDQFPRPLKGSKGLITLYKNHNPGLMMGFLQGKYDLPKWIPFGTIIGVLSYFIYSLTHKMPAASRLSLSLILAGAFSNLIDRFHYGYVVDYFSINIKKLKRVVFNLGDMFIFLGSLLILITETIRDLRS